MDYLKRSWNLSAQAYYRSGRDIIDWVWREDMGSKWHSEQTSSLDTFGIELAGGYTVSEGFLRRVTLSYGYITTDRNADVIAKSAMDFMRHKAALAVEVHFLRRMSLATTATAAIRITPNRATPPLTKNATTSPISCSTDVSSGRRASAGSTSTPRTSPTRATATSAESACRVSGVRAG